MPVSKIRYVPQSRGWETILNGPRMHAELIRQAKEINAMAKIIFSSQVKHTHAPTLPMYITRFGVRDARQATGRRAVQAFNNDPAALWVEFGAYMHSTTHERILRYRPLGRALDAARIK